MKTRIPVPEGGYTLEQLCAIAIDQGLQLHVGVHKQDIAAAPPVITLQVSAVNKNGVVAFRSEQAMTTTILSQCHLTDREWVPEREGLATTLAHIGATMPEIDRQSFVRVMNIGDNHLNSGTMAHHKIHWSGATRCVAINSQKRTSALTFRILGRAKFLQHPKWRRCQYCSEQLESHGSGL